MEPFEPPPRDPPPEERPPADPGARDPEEPELRCSRCGAPYERNQEYCLECGQRLVPLPAFYRRLDVWSRDSPVWLWAALLALLAVALVAGAIVAAAAAGDDDEEGSRASIPVVTTSPTTTDTVGVITDPGTITLDTTTTGPLTTTTDPLTTTILPTTSTFTTTTLPTTTTSPTTTSPSGTISWPTATDGWTVILRSVPTSEGRSEADAAAEDALDAGLPEVGVLDSSNFSSLNPGYYATFTGVYDTRDEAVNALPRARNSGFPLAYAREVAD
jgi:hypothetical protein